MKKIITTLIAAALTLSISTVSFADEISTDTIGSETINIDGYECYERDGHYWTMLEDGECLVIDVGDIEDYPSLDSEFTLEPRGNILNNWPTADWGNKREVNVPHGRRHTETADMSNGDFCTPVFVVFPVEGMESATYEIGCNLSSKQKVNIQFFYYVPASGWVNYTELTTFTYAAKFRAVFVGTAKKYVRGCAFKFLEEGSVDLPSSFDYTFRAHLLFGDDTEV